MSPVDLAVARIIEESKDGPCVPRFYSARGLASRWDCARMSIYRLHRAGRLTGYRIAGKLCFLESDVLRFLQEEGVPTGEKS